MLKSIFNTAPESPYIYVHQIGFEYCKKQKPEREHIFGCVSIHFVISGEGFANGVKLHAGDAYAVRPGQHITYKPDRTNPWMYYWINLSGDIVTDTLDSIGAEEKFECFSFENIKEIDSLFRKAMSENYKKYDMNNSFNALFFSLFSIICVESHIAKSNHKSAAYSHYTNCLSFIKNNFSNDITLEDVALAEGIDRRYMSRLFKIHSARSPQEQLIKMRIEKAKELLLNTEYPVGTIAISVGYRDLLQFSKIFKKHTGVSPLKFRGGSKDTIHQYE